jgi:NADH:ubiquinone oxidoreductase subunit H
VVLAARCSPLFIVYLIAGVAETNRAPFDVAEGESEIVAGFHVEYSGMAFARVLPGRIRQHDPDRGADRPLMFLGGWLSPFPDSCRMASWWIWLGLKTAFCLFLFLWFRATFPALPLRPDHASGLEGVHPRHHRVDRGRRRLDDVAAVDLFH